MSRLYVLMSLTLFLAACKSNDKKGNENTKQESIASSKYSPGFGAYFNMTLNAYYGLKNAFVKSDPALADSAALVLKLQIDSLKLDELRSQDSLAFQGVEGRPGDIAAEIEGLVAEKDLEKKRASFEMISNAMYDLVRAVRPTGQTIYYQYCPMAFNDKGAYWLSSTDSIRNPYFGKKMLICGEVKQVLKY